jgi:uncharacterized protein (DUF2236 family)
VPASGSVARRVNAERLALLGWGRAILLQLAHPLIAAGVYEHSAFRASGWTAVTRLHATIQSMLALTFGTDAEREHALHAIRTIHRRVSGRLSTAVGPFPAGTPYSAEDPALVLWVHLTLLDSVPAVYERFVAPLTEGERDAYCAEAAWVAVALGARDEEVPRTWAAMRRAFERTCASGTLVVGPEAREMARAVAMPGAGRAMPPLRWLHTLVTVGLLPASIREQYGFPWTRRREQVLNRTVPVVRAVRRALPEAVALWADARS